MKTNKAFKFSEAQLEVYLRASQKKVCYIKTMKLEGDISIIFDIIFEDSVSTQVTYNIYQIESLMKEEFGNITYNIKSMQIENNILILYTSKDKTSFWQSENILLVKQLISKIKKIIQSEGNDVMYRFMISKTTEWPEFKRYIKKYRLEVNKCKKNNDEKELQKFYFLRKLNRLILTANNKSIADSEYYNKLKKQYDEELFAKIEKYIEEPTN